MNSVINRTALAFIISAFCMISCSKSDEAAGNANNEKLKGYWLYENGAECYYDGTSNLAKGTKVPDDNSCWKFEIGENYWQNLTYSQDNTWTLDHILRWCPDGTKTYNDATITLVNDTTIEAQIEGHGLEVLHKQP